MKKLFTILGLAIVAITVYAVNISPYSQYATTGVNQDAAGLTNYAVIGAYSANNGTPVVTYLNAVASSAAATVQFYKCTNFTTAKSATTNTRTNTVQSTNGFSAGTVVVVRHVSNDTYERLVCLAPPASTNIAFASDPVSALAIGDFIYQEQTNGVIGVVTNTAASAYIINLVGDGIFSGQKGYPLLLDMIGGAGTNAAIRAVNSTFAP